jgi:hypothetical protein
MTTKLGLAAGLLFAFGCSAPANEPVSDVERPPAELTSDELMAWIAEKVPDFGGAFLGPDGKLNIYTLGTEDDGEGRLEQFVAGSLGRHQVSSGARLLPARYGFGELKRWHDDAVSVFDVASVVLTDLDEARNRVRIGVETANDVNAVEAELGRLGIPLEAVDIEIIDPIFQLATLRDQVSPLAGGLQIHFSNYLCTYGFNAIREGVSGFVTNSHCTAAQGGVESTVYYQPTSSASGAIGTEIADPEYDKAKCPTALRGKTCRYSDSSFAAHAGDTESSLGSLEKTDGANNGSLTIAGSFTIVGESSPLVGQQVNKVGRSSGWSRGNVTATCVNTGVSGTRIVQLCQTHASAAVISGDSGSPVFTQGAGDDVSLAGILWGGNKAGNSFVFSPLANVKRADELGPLTLWETAP